MSDNNTALQAVPEEQPEQSTLARLRTELNNSFAERSELIDGALTALISKEAMFILGPPGTAKSTVCRHLCRAIGGKYYETLMNKMTTPDELFGSISINGLKNDKYIRVTDNKLPEAHIAFLDEVFKGSSAILNTLLTITDESRTFYNGGPVKTPLQTMFGASNEIPNAEELGALWDRFVLRYEVARIQSDDSMANLFRNGLQVSITSISMEQLAIEQEAATRVTVPEETIRLLLELRKTVDQAGFFVSDRRWMQSIRILKAFAHLNGSKTVEPEHFDILENVLWNEPAQKKEIRRIINKVANPVGEVIMKVMDGVNEVYENLKQNRIQAADASNKIKTARKQLEKAGDPKANPKLAAAVAKCAEMQQMIIKEILGYDE
jgi:MoxR-like ATPase